MATRYAVPGRSPSPPLQGEAKIIRTTDSPNCTGACGWNATVVNDVIVDLKPAADYPCAEHNPRGCLRGMSMTHLIYGPDRIQRPRIRSGSRHHQLALNRAYLEIQCRGCSDRRKRLVFAV